MNRSYLRRLLVKSIERANELRALLVFVVIVSLYSYRISASVILFLFPPQRRFPWEEIPSPRNNSRVAASALASSTIITATAILLTRINPVNILIIPAAALFMLGVLFIRRVQIKALTVA